MGKLTNVLLPFSIAMLAITGGHHPFATDASSAKKENRFGSAQLGRRRRGTADGTGFPMKLDDDHPRDTGSSLLKIGYPLVLSK